MRAVRWFNGVVKAAQYKKVVDTLSQLTAASLKAARRNAAGSRRAPGFTLIELIVVMAVIALLLTIAVPRYFSSVDRSKEAALKEDLRTMRDSIDKFVADNGKYPDSLEDLVKKRYVRQIPVDPITNSNETWKLVPPPNESIQGRVYDVKSGAEGNSREGTPYGEL